MIINTEGIVLRQRKIANNRRMIVLFTKRYGKLSAGTSINEKSRGKAALAVRPFTYAEYDIFKGRETFSINSASVKKSFYSIGEELARYEAASAFLSYLDKVMADEEPMPKLFDLSLEFLESVSVTKGSAETLLYAFIVKTLRMLGVAPELSCCVNCGKRPAEFMGMNNGSKAGKAPKLFSVSSGGIICRDCAEVEKTQDDALIYSPAFDIIDVFRYFESKPLKTFEKVDLRQNVSSDVKEILAEYTNRYLGVDVLRGTNLMEV